MSKKFVLPSIGLEVEIGKHARQADGAAWIRHGNNIVLSTAVASKEQKEFMGFFPLTVEYRERPSAAGRIPGGFIKREGKLSDIEVLSSRLIDRPIRPLFPHYYFNEVQLISTVYSSDGKFPTNILATIGSSLALTISEIPFMGPVGAVQIGRINGTWVFNPSFEELQKTDAIVTVSGTKDGICMVEGHCNNIAENELIDVFFKAHEQIKEQVAWQLEIQKEIGKPKATVPAPIDWDAWKNRIKDALPKGFESGFYGDTKSERSALSEKLLDDLEVAFRADLESGAISKAMLHFLFDCVLKEVIPDLIAARKSRFDGRSFTQVRPIFCEIGTLPCAHGSSIFQRGETQALASLTLGTGEDAQKIETLIGGVQERSFMLHYNFPPFATGEVKPMRGVGRREIGHGYLAETSFLKVLPKQEDFPYTVRSVVDIFESNGSSSMATVCATTLALMDGGVPISDMVSGVAMGLLKDSSGNFHILTDIIGREDSYGLMDLKVTGTDKGVLALQMDIKDKVGFTHELFERAFAQAREGRLQILHEMRKIITKPRAEISPYAPRVTFLRVPVDKIGAIIGPSGRNIKDIVARTGAKIDIEDDGTVRIYAKNSDAANEASGWIKTIIGEIEVGTVFDGIIRRFTEFGIFVEVVPGRDGLVHISTIPREKQRDIERMYKVNDRMKVRVTAYDADTGRIRLVPLDFEKPQ